VDLESKREVRRTEEPRSAVRTELSWKILSSTKQNLLHGRKKVAEALDKVINSATKGGKGYSKKTNRQESMDRLRVKVPTTNNQILPLLDAMAKEREECKALIIELERLRTLFNPDNDSNKELYNGDDSEYVGGYGNVEDLSESKRRDW
jgi:hypothetical protein